MPKQKTNKSVRKRFKVTKSGRVRRQHAYTSHLLAGRSQKRKRKLRRSALISPEETQTYLRLMGEG